MKHPFFIQTVLLEQTTLFCKIWPLFFYLLLRPKNNNLFRRYWFQHFYFLKKFRFYWKMVCFRLNFYIKYLADISLRLSAIIKVFSPISRGSLSFLFFLLPCFSIILLFYFCILLLLLAYGNRMCLWNNYIPNSFLLFDWDWSRILLSVLFLNYLLPFLINSFGLSLLPDLFSILLLFRDIFFNSLIFCFAAKSFPSRY